MGKDEALDSVVENLSAQIDLLRARGWEESARLLEAARLDLRLRMHAITDSELESLCVTIDDRNPHAREGRAFAPAHEQDLGHRPSTRDSAPHRRNIRRAGRQRT
jgi:hypothetical protein